MAITNAVDKEHEYERNNRKVYSLTIASGTASKESTVELNGKLHRVRWDVPTDGALTFSAFVEDEDDVAYWSKTGIAGGNTGQEYPAVGTYFQPELVGKVGIRVTSSANVTADRVFKLELVFTRDRLGR